MRENADVRRSAVAIGLVMAAPTASQAATALPTDLSPWGMFQAADLVVQSVMVGLTLAAVVVWIVWLAKWLELLTLRRRLEAGRLHLEAAADLDHTAGLPATGLAAHLVAVARRERDATPTDPAGIAARIELHMLDARRALQQASRRGLGLLATVAATAPFIGLFGTVWGIMNSFIGIARTQTTNLAVVAPGIAEALLATAIGLVAAIPAVIFYNHLGRVVATHRLAVDATITAVQRLVLRDLAIAQRRARSAVRPQAAE